MADPNKFDPKKQGETRTTENQPDSPKTIKQDEKNQGMENPKEYTEGGGFGKQSDPNRDAGQNSDAQAPYSGKSEDQPRKEAVPNQQSPEKKQDKEQPVAGGVQEKSGAKN